MLDLQDTIVAIASPTAPAARGIVRMSGRDVTTILARAGIQWQPSRFCLKRGLTLSGEAGNAREMVSPPKGQTPFQIEPGRPTASTVQIDLGDPLGEIEAMLMLWPTNQSYSGEPSAEIHSIGSVPLLQSLVLCLVQAGARAARPGEFTMRAFLAGQLDLTQAEAVLGVIEAEQRGSLNQALSQLAGNLSRPLERIRGELLNLLADVEAGLDFVDEDIEFVSDEQLTNRLLVIRDQLAVTAQAMQQRGDARSRPIIAIRGNPNAGKSRLLNQLAKREVAIVADQAGTTRDAVVAVSKIDPYEVQFVDTAGIETLSAEDPLSVISVAAQGQAAEASENADIRLWCVDASSGHPQQTRDKISRHAVAKQRRTVDLWVATKSDLVTDRQLDGDWIYTSSVTGEGIEELNQRIVRCLESTDREEIGSVIGTAARCIQSLQRAELALDRVMQLLANKRGHEFVAAELRITVDCLGEITGTVYTDDILDRVFSRFCIGK